MVFGVKKLISELKMTLIFMYCTLLYNFLPCTVKYIFFHKTVYYRNEYEHLGTVTQGRHIGAPINQRADPLASQGVNNPRVLSLIIRTVDMVNQYIHKRSLVMLK